MGLESFIIYFSFLMYINILQNRPLTLYTYSLFIPSSSTQLNTIFLNYRQFNLKCIYFNKRFDNFIVATFYWYRRRIYHI